MIKPPSLQTTYTLVWSKDPALDLPEDEQERERKLRNAQLTGNWHELIKQGQQPTVFHFRNLSRSDLNWVVGETQMSSEHGRPLSSLESDDLMLRLALQSIDNLPGVTIKHGRVGSQKKVATPESIDAVFSAAVGESILSEFALHIAQRASHQLPPLS